jgi:hypothetical protein
VALLGAIVTSAFKRGLTGRLITSGFSPEQAHAIVAKAGSTAAAGGGSLATFRSQAPPGTPISTINAVFHNAQFSFVHAMHVGIFFAIGAMALAAIVSAVFVRSHVEAADVGDGAVAHAG